MARKRMSIFAQTDDEKPVKAAEAPAAAATETASSPADASAEINQMVADFWALVNAVELVEEGVIRQTGVGLRESEIAQLDEIAESLSIGRNSVIRYAVRTLLQMHSAEAIEMQVVSSKRQRHQTRRLITTKTIS